MCLAFLVLLLTLVSAKIEAGQVFQAKFLCGSIIESTSQDILKSLWSSAQQRATIEKYSLGYVGTTILSENTVTQQLYKIQTSRRIGFVTIFEVGNFNGSNIGLCTVTIAPSVASRKNIVVGASRLLLQPGLVDSKCKVPLNARISWRNSLIQSDVDNLTNPIVTTHVFLKSFSDFPLNISFDPNCFNLKILWVVDQHGSLEVKKWVPVVVLFSISLILTLLCLIVKPGNLRYVFVSIVVLFLTSGYMLSITYLVIELSLWKSSNGGSFEYPGSVLFFILSSLLHIFLFIFFCTKYSNVGTLPATGAFRIVGFCSVVGVCIGSFYSGFILLGLLSSVQLFVSNAVLTLHYSYVIYRNYQLNVVNPVTLSNSHIWGCMWCPLTCLAGPTVFLHLCILKLSALPETLRTSEYKFLAFHFIQSTFLLFILHNIITLCIVVTASYVQGSFGVLVWFFAVVNGVHGSAAVFLSYNYYQQSQTERCFLSFFIHGDHSFTVDDIDPGTCNPKRFCESHHQLSVGPQNVSSEIPTDTMRSRRLSRAETEEYWPTSMERIDES